MHRILILLFSLIITQCPIVAQENKEITRIEFNAGTRAYREQIILTPDSVVIIKEDFRVDLKPQVQQRSMTAKEWSALLNSLKDVRLTEIVNLESPSMKRTYDAAAQGSIIITTKSKQSYTHGFDDEDPHAKLKPLMEQIRKTKKK